MMLIKAHKQALYMSAIQSISNSDCEAQVLPKWVKVIQKVRTVKEKAP